MKGLIIFDLDKKFSNTYRQKISDHPFSIIADKLQELKANGFCFVLLSDSSDEHDRSILQHEAVTQLFEKIVPTSIVSSKINTIKQLSISYATDNVIIISDYKNGLDAALANRFPSIEVIPSGVNKGNASNATFQAESIDIALGLVYQLTVFSQIWHRIDKPIHRCIGINGVDTSGKSIFATRFARYILSRGHKSTLIHLDDFHNPRSVRRMGENEIDAYIHNAFNLDALVDSVLKPLREQGKLCIQLQLLDLDSDSYSLQRKYHSDSETIVLLEGVLLYRPPLEEYIDLKVFLDISFDEVIRRAACRDVPKYGEAFLQRYHSKYIPIQQWYLQTHSPKAKSQIVIDNENFMRPALID